MNKLLVASICFLILLISCKKQETKGRNEPIIIVKNDSLILDNLRLGDTISFDIHLENKGKTPYQISNILGNCGCLKFGYTTTQKVPPNHHLKVPVDFIAKKMGSFENTITIKGNTTPSFTVFHFIANIEDTKIE